MTIGSGFCSERVMSDCAAMDNVKQFMFVVCKTIPLCTLTVFIFCQQHTDLSQYLEKHPGGLNAFNVKVSHV